jgi:hypothetical protein
MAIAENSRRRSFCNTPLPLEEFPPMLSSAYKGIDEGALGNIPSG